MAQEVCGGDVIVTTVWMVLLLTELTAVTETVYTPVTV